MSFRNIRLIFRREMRDQLRDRRTLFMIAVLPILFYPLLGVTFFQIAQFLKKHQSRILVVGYEPVHGMPSLIEDGKIAGNLLEPDEASLVEIVYLDREKLPSFRRGKEPTPKELEREMNFRDCQMVWYFPSDFKQKVEDHKMALIKYKETGDPAIEPPKLEPVVVYDRSKDESSMAHIRGGRVMERWREDVANASLKEMIPGAPIDPVTVKSLDLAELDKDRVNVSLWSKVLPFVLLIWAITGAFYPAVDLCAGEKERGTLETLLASPAQRGEIVLGKLVTVMIFSIATALLNLASMGLTGYIVMEQLGDLSTMANVGPPPLLGFIWLALVLIPVSALFSAVCLALAAFAKSTKEGQYYLMPVILISLPLILLPMHPAAELNLGFSLIPVSGIVLLMRSLMEGTFVELWPYAIPVAAVTFACCWFAVRWAIDQFSSEQVLFREGERWDLGLWARHLIRDRQPTPTVAMAVLCGFLILIIRFFMGSFIGGEMPDTFARFARLHIATQLAVILTPALLMTVMLTSRPSQTLLLRRPSLMTMLVSTPAAILLAVALFPVMIAIQYAIATLVEPNQELQALSAEMLALFEKQPFWLILALIALLPAVCEELAFRGFILSGMRHSGHKWRAIIVTSLFFGVAHLLWQQQINAFILGIVLGYLAVQTGSLWPPLVYHLVHNSLAYGMHQDILSKPVFERITANNLYAGAILFTGSVVGLALLLYFHGLSYMRTEEEELVEVLEREQLHSLAS